MGYRVHLSSKSAEDLDTIVEFHFLQSERAAEIVYGKIIHKIESLIDYPERGRIVPEFLDEGIRHYRELIEGNFRIIFKIHDNSITILRILDSRKLNDMTLD